MRKILSVVLSFGLLFQQSGLVYAAGELNLANYLSQAHSAITQPDRFQPARLRYIAYDMQTNDFKLLLDKGDVFNQKTEKPKNEKTLEFLNSPNSSTPKLNNATQELFNYFLIGLALPNDTFWVNLRPDAPENIIDPILEKTDIGKIFLEADLQLKRDTASLTSPQTPEGKAYWDKLYKKAGELFGSENITIPTITRPWIVPNEVIVRETEDSAYIYKATLKVMLEADYLADQKTEKPKNGKTEEYGFSDPRLKELNEYSSQIIRETIIPKLTKEVNSSKRYAKLRQVYYSLVLSRWFKERYRSQSTENRAQIKEKANNYLSLIDSGDLTNLASKESYDKQTYFQAYQKSFKGGEYNLKETVATPSGQSIRSYISGGIITEIKNMSIVGSPVREDVTKALKIGLVGDPSLISTGSPLGEKLIEDDDRYGNIRYVEYEKLSDLSRAYLWNSFQSVTSYVQYDPEYNWGFAIELNKRGGIGRVMGAVKYKKNTETVPLTYVLSDSSEYIKDVITSALKAKTKPKKSDAGSPITVEQLRKQLREIQDSLKKVNKIVIILSNPNKGYNKEIQPISNPLDKIMKAVKRTIDYLGQQEEIPLWGISSDLGNLESDLSGIDLKAKGLENDSKKRQDDVIRNLQSLSAGIGDALRSVKKLYDELGKSAGSPLLGKKLFVNGTKKIGEYVSLNDSGVQKKELLDLVKGKVFPALTVNKSEILGIGAVGAAILSKLMEEEILEEIPSADGFLRVKKSSKIKNIKIKNIKDLEKVQRILKSALDGVKAIPAVEMFHLNKMRFAVEVDKNGEWILLGLLRFGNDNKVEDVMGDSIGIISALCKAWKEEVGVSSAVVSAPDGKTGQWGGIDLTDRALHIKLERGGSFASTPLLLPQVKNAQDLDLDKEFAQVEALASSGIVPNSHRLLELFTVCHYRGEFGERLSQIISCLKVSSAIQEAEAIDSDEDFRLALILPEMLS